MVPEVESTNANCELTSMVSETSNACDAITFTLKVLNWTIRIEIKIMKIIMPMRPYISILESEKKPALVRYDAENTREKRIRQKIQSRFRGAKSDFELEKKEWSDIRE